MGRHFYKSIGVFLAILALWCGKAAAQSSEGNRAELVVGVIDFIPYNIPETPGRPGLHTETVQTIMDASGLEYQMRQMPPRRLIQAVDEGTVDVILFGDLITRVNDNFIDLGIIYDDANHALVMRDDPNKPYSEYLQNKTVVVPNLRAADSMAEYLVGINFIQITNYTVALRMLSDQRVDAVLGLEPTLRYFSQYTESSDSFHYAVVISSTVRLFHNKLSLQPNDVWDKLSKTREMLHQEGLFYQISERYMPGWQNPEAHFKPLSQ